jgi:iron complex outermembrane receptor protein
VEALFATRTYSQILDDRQLDGSVSYQIEEGTYKNLTFSVQATNLTNSPYRDTSGNFSNGSITPQTYELYGRTILVGVNYRFDE